jgi:hypothetical protein
MLKRAATLVGGSVQVIALPALDNRRAPSYDDANADKLTAIGILRFAFTPHLFGDLMAASVQQHRLDLGTAIADIVRA